MGFNRGINTNQKLVLNNKTLFETLTFTQPRPEKNLLIVNKDLSDNECRLSGRMKFTERRDENISGSCQRSIILTC